MAQKNPYQNYLKETLEGLIDKLEISDLRKDFLKNRWLDQLTWLENRASEAKKWHHRLRLVTVVGGVVVPALVGLNSFQSSGASFIQSFAAYGAFVISQIVAVSAALEEFFGYSEKYINYRNTAENMKIEGWQYFQLAGPYHSFKNHSDAYTYFAERVEQYIQKDVQGFLAQFEERLQEEINKSESEVVPDNQIALDDLNEQPTSRAQQSQPSGGKTLLAEAPLKEEWAIAKAPSPSPQPDKSSTPT